MPKTTQDILREKIHKLAQKSGSHKIKWYNKIAEKSWKAANLSFIAVVLLIMTNVVSLSFGGHVLYFAASAWWGFSFVFLYIPLRSQYDFDKKNKILDLIEKRPDLAELIRPAFENMATGDLSSYWYKSLDNALERLLKEERQTDPALLEDTETLKDRAMARALSLMSSRTENNTVVIDQGNCRDILEREVSTTKSAQDIARERWKI